MATEIANHSKSSLAPLRVALVHESADDRIPEHIHQTHDKEHCGRYSGLEAEHVGVEEQQPDAYGLVDEILRHVARAEADALEPGELVEALRFACRLCHRPRFLRYMCLQNSHLTPRSRAG